MANVFISYKKEDRDIVVKLANALRGLGLSVWFDASLNPGETFDAEINREVNAADCVLVCWTPQSGASDWVRSEAMIGFNAKKLAAAFLKGPDGFVPPAPFNLIHMEDLRGWGEDHQSRSSNWRNLLRRIGQLTKREDILSYGGLSAEGGLEGHRAWLRTHPESPLFALIEGELRQGEAVERRRRAEEAEARARWEAEEAARREAKARRQADDERRERTARVAAERAEAERSEALRFKDSPLLNRLYQELSEGAGTFRNPLLRLPIKIVLGFSALVWGIIGPLGTSAWSLNEPARQALKIDFVRDLAPAEFVQMIAENDLPPLADWLLPVLSVYWLYVIFSIGHKIDRNGKGIFFLALPGLGLVVGLWIFGLVSGIFLERRIDVVLISILNLILSAPLLYFLRALESHLYFSRSKLC